ncbi:MAG: hypothetical protein ACD_79C00436G0002 [uncultured bacterium]|nr:MAG: hypothetical protein ACD_79C00436G0002 [uncultured bacterium]
MIPISKPIIESEEIEAVNAVLVSGMLAQGPLVRQFEEEFANYCNVKYAVALNSGTAAIHAGLYALGLKEGDEVITSPFTFVASANPVLMLGGKVIFADISEDDFNIDPKEIEKKISTKTRCILPIDLYGQIYKSGEVKMIADTHGLSILEDACQAVGAEQNGKKAGVCADIGAFSLYSTKNIMCGEGGVLITNNEEYSELAKRFRHHGQSEQTRYEYLDVGYNYRMMDLQAAIAIAQLKKVDIFNEKRRLHARQLSHGLEGIRGLILPSIAEGNKHVFHQYTIRITDEFRTDRGQFINYLKEKGIGCGIYYPKPLHMHPHFKKMGYNEGDFPIAEKMSTQVLSLPVHPSLTEEEINFILDMIHKYVG